MLNTKLNQHILAVIKSPLLCNLKGSQTKLIFLKT